MFRALLYIFLIYLLYQFIFNFLIPVYKATQQVKKGFREMQDRMNDSGAGKQDSSPEMQSQGNSDHKPVGEYIDFEEIK